MGDVFDDVVVEHARPELVLRTVAGAREDRLAGSLHVGQIGRVDLQNPELPFHVQNSRLDAGNLT